MKNLRNDVDSFNNLVFESRNKEYGAYAIRADYNANKIKSTLITAAFFMTAVGVLWLFSGGKQMVQEVLATDDTIITVVDVGPKEDPKPVEQPKVRETAATHGDIPTTVSNTAPEHDVKPNELMNNPVNGQSNDPNANGNSTTSTVLSDTTVAVIHVETPVENKIYQWVSDMPEYKGNLMAFIQSQVVYPETAILNGTEGVVYVQFVVDELGEVSNVKTVKGIGDGCDQEAMRVVRKLNGWKPGKNNGKAVKVFFNIPIRFKLAH
jgi:periplasmic protein TonB